MQKYINKGAPITAVQINIDCNGIDYEKWGGWQKAKQGDWLVDNNGEVYTIDVDSFAKTYDEVSPGRYIKTAFVWASPALVNGTLNTKEGITTYKVGDMIVANDEDGKDSYAMSKAKFDSLYDLAS